MSKEFSEYEKVMNVEIETRLSELEKSDYDLGKPFNNHDWIFVGLAVLTGLVVVICGLL